MNDEDAISIIKNGVTYEELREMMIDVYNGARSIVIPSFTKAEAFKHLRACIDRKFGRVHPDSADALTARMIIVEFWADR